MELTSVTSLASKLLAALEKSGISSGAELRSTDGPSGAPAQELIKAFEEALEGTPKTDVANAADNRGVQIPDQSAPAQHPAETPDAPAAIGSDDTLAMPDAARPPGEQIRTAATNPDSPPQAPSASNEVRELEGILRRMDAGQMRPEDLFRAQYLIGMLKVQTESGTQASRKTAQGFESLLKQQG